VVVVGVIATQSEAGTAIINMPGGAAIPALIRALIDDDMAVAYCGVISLAEMTGTNAYAPSKEKFLGDPGYYLDYWREWARAR